MRVAATIQEADEGSGPSAFFFFVSPARFGKPLGAFAGSPILLRSLYIVEKETPSSLDISRSFSPFLCNSENLSIGIFLG